MGTVNEPVVPTAGAVYESLRPCGLDRPPTRLMVTQPGSRESVVVNAYTGRAERTILSARLHEFGYDKATRRHAKSGYLRTPLLAEHLLTVLRAGLATRRLADDIFSGGSVGHDPARGGTISLTCPETHPAVQASTQTLAVLGWSAVLIPDAGPRAVLRVRYGPGGLYCPARWLTRDDWTMHYCAEHVGHDGPEHYDRHTGDVWWDGDNDGLDWIPGPVSARDRPAMPTRPSRPEGRGDMDYLAVLADALATENEDTPAVPKHARLFAAQLHTTELRRSAQPGLRSFGPLDQVQPRAMEPGAVVIDGDGTPWQLGPDNLWTAQVQPGATAPGSTGGRVWQALAFRYAPLTEQATAAAEQEMT